MPPSLQALGLESSTLPLSHRNSKKNPIKSFMFVCVLKEFKTNQDLPCLCNADKTVYYIPITDTTLELSVFWPSDTESRINELRFSESISLSFKTRLTSVPCVCGDVTES